MGANTHIQWATHTFNPWRGCTKVSDGCKFCYAETLSGRNPGTLGVWGPNGTRVVASEAMWREPLKWNRAAQEAGERHRVFCASLADVFEDYSGNFPDLPDGAHGGVKCMVDASGARLCTRAGQGVARQWPDEPGWRPYTMVDARQRLFELIEATPHLDWLLLTKRPENVARMIPDEWDDGLPENVWLGTSVEDQKAADERIPELLKIPARVRFLSCEPLLGPLTLYQYWQDLPDANNPTGAFGQSDCWETWLDGLDWVIGGGESGSLARPCHPDWARELRDQCLNAAIAPAFFWKQWGEWLPFEEEAQQPFWLDQTGECHDGHGLNILDPETAEVGKGWHPDSLEPGNCAWKKVGKKASGRSLDGRTWDETPEVANAAS